MRRLALALTLGLVAASPAQAQDINFTTADADLMVACTDAALERLQTDAANPDMGTSDAPLMLRDCVGAASGPCMDTDEGMSTIGMTECMARETDWWDSQLNVDYAALREVMDEESAEALQAAQRAWIDWRDAKCEFEYTYWRQGTIRSTFYGSCMLDLTAERAIDLKTYVGWGEL